MPSPESISTICTYGNHEELELLLGTLSIHHPGIKIYIFSDIKTKKYIEASVVPINLRINWSSCLDNYSGANRLQLESQNEWTQFMSKKFDVMDYALTDSADTLFLDSDQIIIGPIEIPDKKLLGLSRQDIPFRNREETGYFNGGFVWTSDKEMPRRWREQTIETRYFEQSSLEKVALEYSESFFEFPDNYNLMPWSQILNGLSEKDFASQFQNVKGTLYYNWKPLKTVHTHLRDNRFTLFNKTIKSLLGQIGNYRELTLIQKCETGKFTITIPSQPKNTIFNHTNDSFRELAKIASNQPSSNLRINTSEATNHCWLEPSILLYDRPTLEWADNELNNSNCILLGNGDIEQDGEILNKISTTRAWTFWPRKPNLL